MPRMLAAWVRFPRQCLSVSRIRSRSTSATVRPTSARVTCSAASVACATAGAALAVSGGGAAGVAVGRQNGLGSDLVALRHQHGAVHSVFQLADVALPAIDGEHAPRVR